MWIVSGTYRGIPLRVRWDHPGDVAGQPFLPWPILYADRTSARFHFTYPDGIVVMSLQDEFAAWAYVVRLLDHSVTSNQPEYPADWPERPVGRGVVA